jgi:serine protease Do
VRRIFILICLICSVTASDATCADKRTTSLAEFSTQLEKLAADVAPGVVQVQVSAWSPADPDHSDVSAVLKPGHIVGSGVIVDPSGYIVTNEHVIHGARRIRVMLNAEPDSERRGIVPIGKRRTLDAVVVGVHPESDLALLKVEASGLHALSFSGIGSVHQGQVVVAVGSPVALDNSISLGIVSAVARQPDPDTPLAYIQTDAAINPGNSGGPLLDVDGHVIGINTFIMSDTGGNEGLGFAVPAPVVRFVYEQLRTNGFVRRSNIGVEVQTITSALAQAFALDQNYGVLISDVWPGSPAETAGLKVQDVIVSVDGTAISSVPLYVAEMYLHNPGAPMRVNVLRHGESLEFRVPVVSDNGPSDTEILFDPAKSFIPRLTILGRTLDPAFANQFGLRSDSGVYVVARTTESGPSDQVVVAGDVIRSLNGVSIYSLAQLQKASSNLPPDDPAVLQIERKGHLVFVSLESE